MRENMEWTQRQRISAREQTAETVLAAQDNLDAVISMADSFIRRQYLTQLAQAQVVPLGSVEGSRKAVRSVRLFQVESLSYAKTDEMYRKLADLFHAAAQFDASQILLLDSDGFQVSLYLGISSSRIDQLSTQFRTLKGSFLGNFPGAKIKMMNVENKEELIHSIFDESGIKISAVSALASAKSCASDHIYSMERFVDAMRGQPFTMLLLSQAVAKEELSSLRQSCEAMYTQLSPYREYTFSMNQGESKGSTQSFGMTKNESVSTAESVTENVSFGDSKSWSETESSSQKAEEARAKNQLLGTAVSLAALVAGIGAENVKMNPLQGLFYGGSVSNIISSAQTLLYGAQPGRTQTKGESKSRSISFSEGETSSRQIGFSITKNISDNTSDSASRSIQMRYENRSVRELLAVLDEQISRLRHIEEMGGFQCAAYFVTGDQAAAATAANMYRSLLDKSSIGQGSAVNLWSDPDEVEMICSYLKRMKHPLFHFEHRPNYPVFSAGTLTAADEMPMYASLPLKSLSGLPVALRAEFARDVIRTCGNSQEQIRIGNIFHMGKTEKTDVYLSKEDLSGHLFVTGTTGTGKSNFCYGLLDQLRSQNVKFLVIEPAKGEYKNVFGGCPDVHVFGTNPDLTFLLRIHPFSFPSGIHVSEHIDRLLEIFNSCWPMYAAMPEVLKKGLETIYRQCGYHLITGRADRGHRFPTFDDLLHVLPEIIKESEFSTEVKGNYIGSLVTRVESLTGGLYRCIFTENEIEPSVLFDENVLIDISRIGSATTKSLIMGILIMKLQEYRMSQAQMDMSLRHVTVLEEAHHLLRASSPSSAEGVNLRAMSLEMITNAIAEMRTYGEGIVIADQSPAMMDRAVLRNTNTKIVFKLPEQSDRQAAANAMPVDEMQTREIARLEKGVAAVYQSGWDNAVLAKIRYFDRSNFKPYVHQVGEDPADERQIYSQCLSVLLKDRLAPYQESSLDTDLCRHLLEGSMFADGIEKACMEVIQKYIGENEGMTGNSNGKAYCEKSQKFTFGEICRNVDQICDTKTMVEHCGSTKQLAAWEMRAVEYLASIVDLTRDEYRELILLCINIRCMDSPEVKKLYFRYSAYIYEKGKQDDPNCIVQK